MQHTDVGQLNLVVPAKAGSQVVVNDVPVSTSLNCVQNPLGAGLRRGDDSVGMHMRTTIRGALRAARTITSGLLLERCTQLVELGRLDIGYRPVAHALMVPPK
jgi:hypothetical protein